MRILTRLPEIFYSLGKHWLLVGIFIVLGGVVSWIFFINKPKVYEGNAQLIVNPSDTHVPNPNEDGTPRRPQGQSEALINSHVTILSSDSVYRQVYGQLQEFGIATEEDTSKASEEDAEKSFADRARGGLATLGEFVSSHLGAPEPDSVKTSPDKGLSEFIERFKERSEVVVEPKSNTITLLLRGPEPKAILRQLGGWINAYLTQVKEMQLASLGFVEERIEHWRKEEERKRTKLDDFLRANPDVSVYEQKRLEDRIRAKEGDLHRLDQGLLPQPQYPLLAPGTTGSSGNGLTKEEEARLDAATKDVEEADKALRDAQATGFTSKHEKTKLLKERLRLAKEHEVAVREEINEARRKRLGASASPSLSDRVQLETKLNEEYEVERERLLAQRRAKVSGEIDALRQQRTELTEKLKVFQTLDKEHKSEQVRRIAYEDAQQFFQDLAQSWGMVNVQIADSPWVPLKPYKYHPLRFLGIGCLLGLVVGMFLALLIEIFSTKVRFKQDIVEDCGLPVVGVVPKRFF